MIRGVLCPLLVTPFRHDRYIFHLIFLLNQKIEVISSILIQFYDINMSGYEIREQRNKILFHDLQPVSTPFSRDVAKNTHCSIQRQARNLNASKLTCNTKNTVITEPEHQFTCLKKVK